MKIYTDYEIDLGKCHADINLIEEGVEKIQSLSDTHRLRGEINPIFSDDRFISYESVNMDNTVMYVTNVRLIKEDKKLLIDIVFDQNVEDIYYDLERGFIDVKMRYLYNLKQFKIITFDLFYNDSKIYNERKENKQKEKEQQPKKNNKKKNSSLNFLDIAIIISLYFIAISLLNIFSVYLTRGEQHMKVIEEYDDSLVYNEYTGIVYREEVGTLFISSAATYEIYYNRNGKLCRYENGELVEITEDE